MTETKEEIRRLLHEPDGPQRLMGRVSELRDRLWELWLEQDAAAAGLLARGARRKEMAAWLGLDAIQKIPYEDSLQIL